MQIGKLSNTLKITRADWLRWCFHISIETQLHVQYYKLLSNENIYFDNQSEQAWFLVFRRGVF